MTLWSRSNLALRSLLKGTETWRLISSALWGGGTAAWVLINFISLGDSDGGLVEEPEEGGGEVCWENGKKPKKEALKENAGGD